MKRIIFSTYDSINNPFFYGGAAIAIHQVAKRLSDRFVITVIAGKYSNVKNKNIDGVFYKYIGTSFGGPKMGQLIYSLVLPFYVIREKYDIWVENFTPPFSTGFLQLFTKKPVIGLVHMLSGKDMKRKYHLPFEFVENIGLKTYKLYITTTDLVNRKIAKVNPKAKITVISNGVEKISNNTGARKYALFVGRLELNQKGIDLLLNAWRKINHKLIIAGNGQDIESISDLIKNYDLSKRVKLAGRTDSKNKEVLFKNAAFVVIPSRFETFSMTSLEAFSYGLPIVSFDIEGLGWVPRNASLKVGKFDVEQFAEKCAYLFNNIEKAKGMGRVGQKFTEDYTWEKISHKYEQLFAQL